MKKALIIEVGVIRILVVVLQLVFLKIYTNHTSVYELGIYYFLFTASYSLNAFLLVPLDYFQQSQIYNLKGENYSLKSFYGINLWVLKASGLILVFSLIICSTISTSYLSVIIIIILLALSTYLVNLLRGLINNLERRRMAIYTLLAESFFKIGFYFLLSHFYGYSSTVILSSLLFASLTTFSLLAFLVQKTNEFRSSKVKYFDSSEILTFAYPISIAAVINWIQLQGYRMILVPLGLVEIVGVYGTVANVGTSGMSAVSTIYSQLFIPNLYKTHGDYIATYLKYAILSICGVFMVGYLLSSFIISLLTKAAFVQYSSLIGYGIISEGGNFLISALTVYVTIKGKTKATIKASLAGLLAFAFSFSCLYFMKLVTVYTIGLPIVITQIIITLYLAVIVARSRKEIN